MNYYNEFDPNAAAWLRELINNKLIPAGDVDTRSIKDVRADDLRKYTQCHFFAGIGGWSYALQLAGWPADKPVWTGSCPCQAFSVAGKQLGVKDERDLWPVFYELIRECRPEYVFGEQVENAIRHGWLDRVYADMEAEGYACGAAVLGAHSVNAPHQRQRLYWGGARVHNSLGGRLSGCNKNTSGEKSRQRIPEEAGDGGGLADGDNSRLEGRGGSSGSSGQQSFRPDGVANLSPWSDFRFIYCRDGKIRRVPAESVFLGVADGVSKDVDGSGVVCISEDGGFPLTTQKEGRSMLLKGYGNAIVPELAAEFITAFMEEIK